MHNAAARPRFSLRAARILWERFVTDEQGSIRLAQTADRPATFRNLSLRFGHLKPLKFSLGVPRKVQVPEIS